jgi:hypothetical protein
MKRLAFIVLVILSLSSTAHALPISEWSEIRFWGVVDDPGGFYGSLGLNAGDPFIGLIRYDPEAAPTYPTCRLASPDIPCSETWNLTLTVGGLGFGLSSRYKGIEPHYSGGLSVVGEADSGIMVGANGSRLTISVLKVIPTSYLTGTITGVPEPSSLLLLALGLAGVIAMKFKRSGLLSHQNNGTPDYLRSVRP